MKYLSLIFLFLGLSACQQNSPKLMVLEGNAIGTTYSIRYLDSDERSFEKDIQEIIKAVNRSTSTYQANSDISRINQGDTSVVVDKYFADVFQKSARIYKETSGYFDPTIGVLVNAWGFGPESAQEELDSVKIKELLSFVGFEKVALINGKVQKEYPEIYFDFNAIGKGYLVDVISWHLEDNNIENYLVEIGGEIKARGLNQNDQIWTIAIENPNFDGSRSFATTIELHNKSIATSGNYRKFRTTNDGNRFVHTINPKSGFATSSNLLSASVIGPTDCADVDGYATAFMAMGLEATIEFVKNRSNLEVFLIYADEEGSLKTYQYPMFKS
jgi:thiamine biosynthesis lipoprotein